MCGIVGILTLNPSYDELSRINDLLTHRGPDDAGVYIGEGIGLAARRLSIIDLEGGHQPLSNEDGRIWLVCNGEIVNAPALRRELEVFGHVFSTRTDIETIVHAYEQWGDGVVERLRGMFAFALWDANRRRLLLARDRFGIKPLYYAQAGNNFAFASDIRPILQALPGLSRRANLDALWYLAEISYIPTPLTAFQDVWKLPPANILTLDNSNLERKTYWQLKYPSAGGYLRDDPESIAEEFIARLRETLDGWRMSDVPVGSLLSGGIDSASVATLLTGIIDRPIHTFNIGFESTPRDEARLARETARLIGSHHHEIAFTSADFDNHLPKIVSHLEEPQSTSPTVPMFLLYRACAEAGYKVIMSGQGADELLGGYYWYTVDRRLRPYLLCPRPIRGLIAQTPLIKSRGPHTQRAFALATRDPIQRYILWQQAASTEDLSRLFTQRTKKPLSEFWRRQFADRCKGNHPLNQFLLLESQTRLVNFINLFDDRMSMANSVESRPGFLDHLLWEFCSQLPPEIKLSPEGNKYLLRLGMQHRLPETITKRPKKGLTAPFMEWWLLGKLPAWAQEVLHPSALAESGYFNLQEVNRLLAPGGLARARSCHLLTIILTTQLWHFNVLGG